MLSIKKFVLSSNNSDYKLTEVEKNQEERVCYWIKKKEGILEKLEKATYLSPKEVEEVFNPNYHSEEIYSNLEEKIKNFKSENLTSGGKVFWIDEKKKEVFYSGDVYNIKRE